MTESLSPLERAVLDLIVSRDEDGYAALREQLASVEVISREVTGGGFFTRLHIPSGGPMALTTVGKPGGTDGRPETFHRQLAEDQPLSVICA